MFNLIIFSAISILLNYPILFLFRAPASNTMTWPVAVVTVIVNLPGLIFWWLLSLILNIIFRKNYKRFGEISDRIKRIYFISK